MGYLKEWLYLCFAEDLLMFSKGDAKSIILLLRGFAKFSYATGLEANRGKSAIYFSNVDQETQHTVLQMSGFVRGELPFRYLGIPISSKKLNKSDCECILDRMIMRIRIWSSRHLSYAARAQLVNSILMNLHTYWASITILPKYILLKIATICRNFLWDGGPDALRFPPLAWSFVCKSKTEGGLGIRDVFKWNFAAVGKHVWDIARKADLLWVKWVNVVYLKGKEWWDYKHGPTASWYWKQVCCCKDMMVVGYLCNQWNGVYSVSSGYHWLRRNSANVPWFRWVWCRFTIPKHSFVSWLSMLQRLLLKDRLFRYGIAQNDTCIICVSN